MRRHWKGLSLAVTAICAMLGLAGLSIVSNIVGSVSNGATQETVAITTATTMLECLLQPEPQKAYGQWNGGQMTNAATIIATGQVNKVPEKGEIIAVTAAMADSHLRNLHPANSGSYGLFQQRPSQKWGSRKQLMTPVYATAKFYRYLKTVPGWPQLSVAAAAQRVQKLHNPGQYKNYQKMARPVVLHLMSSVKLAQQQCTAGDSAWGGTGPIPSGKAQQIARQMLPKYGWGPGQWSPLVKLWTRESNWRTTATNPQSGAFGIAQALGHGTVGTAAPDGENMYGGYGLTDAQNRQANAGNATQQIHWGLNYIKATYGTPQAAWAFELANNGY